MNIKIILLICLLSFGVFAQNKDDKIAMTRNNTEPLKIGEIAPDFALNDQNGKSIKLSKIKKPVTLVFYRGYW